MRTMIAIFSGNDIDMANVILRPPGSFKRIQMPGDIRGRRFTGVLIFHSFFSLKLSRESIEAYDELQRIQPELFK